ncbi:prepilin-type N-terminal cleavage/methylation domain-containing protein [uncultured Gimesia sp.]|uniref:PulJ/GspJ family protein n=1 Tax=uncultured Gimesia sp. TaxID=1678688 RepID=UPI0030D7250D|tara:strand:- start:73911 stop:74519 length:609 start_codon:yes stop_codon:yes gene_type:complete
MNKLKQANSQTQNTSSKNTNPIPKGVSLIEMLLVISLMSVIFTVAITTLGLLMRVEMKGTARIQETLNFQRLSRQFREDAGLARKAVIIAGDDNKSDQLKFEIEPDTSIIYSKNKAGNSILRSKQQLEKVIASDEFRISVELLQFQIEKKNNRELVSMLLQFFPEEIHDNQTVKKTTKILKVESLVSQKHSLQNRMEINNSN